MYGKGKMVCHGKLESNGNLLWWLERNGYSVCQSNVWAKYMVSHGWHGQKGLSEGCMGGGMFVIGSVFATFCCRWYGHVRHS